MPNLCKTVLSLSISSFMLTMNAVAATTFTDTEFDVDDYRVVSYTGYPQSAEITQTLDGGNTGPALSVLYTVEAFSRFSSYSVTYVFGKSFVYDPSAGPVQSLDVSYDFSIEASSSDSRAPYLQPPSLILYQNDQYFKLASSRLRETALGDSFTRFSYANLQPADFYRLSVPSRGDIYYPFDGIRPDFGGGAMQFGLMTSYGATTQTNQFVPVGKVLTIIDNLSITVNPVASTVPEPSEAAWMGIGLAAIAVALRRTNRHKGGSRFLTPTDA
jgi:hypothetical protein